MKPLTFRPGVKFHPYGGNYPDMSFKWQAIVYGEYPPTGEFVCWSQPCSTRWGANRLAKRMVKKMRKAQKRGEL